MAMTKTAPYSTGKAIHMSGRIIIAILKDVSSVRENRE